MAAITPGIGRQQFVSRIAAQYFKCVGAAESGLGGAGPQACPTPGEILSQAHTGLLQMIYVRSAVERMFAGRSFTVMSGRPVRRKNGSVGISDPDKVYLVLDGPLAFEDGDERQARLDPLWNPMASPFAAAYKLLSWTSKMNAPSFSLPAGSSYAGGTCPGALAGQSVADLHTIAKKKVFVDRVSNRIPRELEVDLASSTCEHCVTGDALILVQGRGTVRIADLVERGAFSVWSGIDWRSTHAVFQGVQQVMELFTDSGHSLRATPEHKFLTPQGMIELQQLRPGDRVLADPCTQEREVRVVRVTSLPIHEPVYDLVNVGDEHQFVANGLTVSNCYAMGGQYSTGGVQVAQVLRYLWVRQALRTPYRTPEGRDSTMFIETMIAAILGADFKLDGGTIKIEETELDGVTAQETLQQLPPEPTGRRFFRIHDSGDFFSPEYLAQWKAVANALPHITFWAPSRVWAVSPTRIDEVNQINTPFPDGTPSNLIIRPSGYYVNEPPPDARQLGPGWAAGTTVIMHQLNQGMTPAREHYVARHEGRPDERAPGGTDPRYTWDCRAYAVDDQGHTCRKAVAPPGQGDARKLGCRACWIAPQEVVNYTLH